MRTIYVIIGYSAIWMALTNGDMGSLVVGIPAIAWASWLSVKVMPGDAWRLSASACVRFVPWFLLTSFKGACDVAMYAVRPVSGLEPGLATYDLRLPAGASRVFLINVISLLPGTVTVGVEHATLTLHYLDHRIYNPADIATAEYRVAKLFGHSLDTTTLTVG